MGLVRFGLITLICLAPVLGPWAWTFPILGLLLFFQPGKGGARGLWGWEFGLVGLIFGLSAAFSTGFSPGRNGFTPQSLLQTESWILMAWLVSRAPHWELGRIIPRFLVLTSPIWIIMGFQQLAAGVPTNPGWLPGAQSKLIPVRIFSVFVNPNIYALYLLGIFVLAVEFAALPPDSGRRLNRCLKMVYGMIAGLALLSLYFTYSRMAWLLAGVFGFGRLIRRWKWRGWLVTVGSIISLLALPAVQARLGSFITLNDSSLLYRIRIWQGVIRALGVYWLWGAGPGSFPAIYPLYQTGNAPAQHAHQLYLQIWLEYGIFALGGFIFLAARLLRNHDLPGLRTMLLLFLGFGFSETWYLNHDLGGLFWLAAGLLKAAPGGSQNRSGKPETEAETVKRAGNKRQGIRHIVIFGYFGCRNLGDETNLSQLVTMLRQMDACDPGLTVTVLSASPEATARLLGVRSIGKYHLPAILRAFRKADLLIGGPGSLFQDRTSLRSLLYYALIVASGKLFGLPIFLFGQGIGPVRTLPGKLITRAALSAVKVITVRDRLSVIALANLKIRKPEIHITAEPLLLKNPAPKALVLQYWAGENARAWSLKRFKTGLIFQESGRWSRGFWEELLSFLSCSKEVECYLIPINPQDAKLLQGLAGAFQARLLPLQTNWEEFLGVLGGLDLLVSTRLHGLVAAVVQQVSCYGLAADPKVEGFCVQLGLPFISLAAGVKPLGLCNRILSCLADPIEKQRPWQSQLAFWKARAFENQVLLHRFIEGEGGAHTPGARAAN
ncbi:MAG: polysaccharide pyruvyl transferase family protein [Firmicutes bacterium]|nr:polysaccharide pyruvyl transferase family protein [Bacillota bacterium]